MEYRFCKYCGRELPTGKTLSFCPYCGNKLPVAPVTPPQHAVEPTTQGSLSEGAVSRRLTEGVTPTPAPTPVEPTPEPTTQDSLFEGAVSRRLTEGATPTPAAPPQADAPAPARTSKLAREPKPRAECAPKMRKRDGKSSVVVLAVLIILLAAIVSAFYVVPMVEKLKDAEILEQIDTYLAENDVASALSAAEELFYPDDYTERLAPMYYVAGIKAKVQYNYGKAIEYFTKADGYSMADKMLRQCQNLQEKAELYGIRVNYIFTANNPEYDDILKAIYVKNDDDTLTLTVLFKYKNRMRYKYEVSGVSGLEANSYSSGFCVNGDGGIHSATLATLNSSDILNNDEQLVLEIGYHAIQNPELKYTLNKNQVLKIAQG